MGWGRRGGGGGGGGLFSEELGKAIGVIIMECSGHCQCFGSVCMGGGGGGGEDEVVCGYREPLNLIIDIVHVDPDYWSSL